MKSKTKLKRFFNFRPLCLLFLTFIFATYAVVKLFAGKILPSVLLLIYIFGVIIIFALSLFDKSKFENLKSVFGIKNLCNVCLLVLACAMIASALASANLYAKSQRHFANSAHTITATVREVVKKADTQSVLLGKLKIDGKTEYFKIKASCDLSLGELSVGDELTFGAYLFANDLMQNGAINSSALKSNIQYFCTIPEGFAKKQGRAYFVDYAKDKIKNAFLSAMDEGTAGFCYAVVVGDKSLVSEEYYQIFRDAGVAHILAVSGLHIAFLVAIILAICKLFRAGKKTRFWIVATILLLYNILCEFSPSVFRASVMSLCLLFGSNIGERNDNLSSLSLAGIIILLSCPLNLFDAGFCLSFSAVFGIFLFEKQIARLFEKIHIAKIVAEPVAVTLSAGVGTFPFVCKFFGEFAPITILSNLVVLPLFTLAYYILLPSIVFAVLISPSVLCVANFFAKIVTNFSALFAKFGLISLFDFDALSIVVYFVILLFASPYCMLKTKSKLICCFAFALSISTVLANCNTQKYYNYYSISATQRLNNVELITTDKNIKILFGVGDDSFDKTSIKALLKNAKVCTIDHIFLCNYSDGQQAQLSEIAKQYSAKSIYLFGEYDESTVQGAKNCIDFAKVIAIKSKNFQVAGIVLNFYAEGQKYKAVDIDFGNSRILLINYSVSAETIKTESFFQTYFDLALISNAFDLRYELLNCDNQFAFSLTTGTQNLSNVGELWTTKL